MSGKVADTVDRWFAGATVSGNSFPCLGPLTGIPAPLNLSCSQHTDDTAHPAVGFN